MANEDKYLLHVQNCIKQHIGLEHSDHIHYALTPVEGKKILQINITPYKNGAFLKHGEEEEDFYIRIGPASRKLKTSKAVAYLEERKKDRSL